MTTLVGHWSLVIHCSTNRIGEPLRPEDSAQPKRWPAVDLDDDGPDAEQSTQDPCPALDGRHVFQADRWDGSEKHAEIDVQVSRRQPINEARAAIGPDEAGCYPPNKHEP